MSTIIATALLFTIFCVFFVLLIKTNDDGYFWASFSSFFLAAITALHLLHPLIPIIIYFTLWIVSFFKKFDYLSQFGILFSALGLISSVIWLFALPTWFIYSAWGIPAFAICLISAKSLSIKDEDRIIYIVFGLTFANYIIAIFVFE